LAAPNTSLPHIACGIVALCIAVISLYLHSFNAFCVSGDRGKWINFRTPVKDFALLFSEDFRGGTASGFEPDSGFVSCAFLKKSNEREERTHFGQREII